MEKGQGMKKSILLAAAICGSFWLIGCTPAAVKDAKQVQATATGTESCMACHGDDTVLNNKIQNARDTWVVSAHAQGIKAPLKDGDGNIIEMIAEGPNSYYANGGGCQVCHTKEGFNKKAEGKYADQAAIDADYVQSPSSLTCFTCHKPHTKGNFDLVIPPEKAITLTSGATYDKSKGSICASCHQARTPSTGSNTWVLDNVKKGVSSRLGMHYGVQSDMLLGVGGAEYEGKTYSSSAHKSNKDANCITCHMPYPAKRFSGSNQLAGHSFNAVTLVHGTETGNTTGCVTCHPNVSTTNAKTADGHIQKGDVYFKASTSDTNYSTVNTLMKALVDPTKGGDGLLMSAVRRTNVAGATASILFSADNRYKFAGIYDTQDATKKVYTLKDATATSSESSEKARFLKALVNYMFVWEDRSFGVHNGTYAKQLLWDAANDLKTMGATTSVDIGTRP